MDRREVLRLMVGAPVAAAVPALGLGAGERVTRMTSRVVPAQSRYQCEICGAPVYAGEPVHAQGGPHLRCPALAMVIDRGGRVTFEDGRWTIDGCGYAVTLDAAEWRELGRTLNWFGAHGESVIVKEIRIDATKNWDGEPLIVPTYRGFWWYDRYPDPRRVDACRVVRA